MSDIIETVPNVQSDPSNVNNVGVISNDKSDKSKWMSYAITITVVCLVLYVFYYSWCCFQENQCEEPFIEKTIKTGIDDDKSFDIDKEVKRLSDIQESYLRKLNAKRNF